MFKKILYLILFILIQKAFSQINYNLAKYKTPLLERQVLTTSFDFSRNDSKNEIEKNSYLDFEDQEELSGGSTYYGSGYYNYKMISNPLERYLVSDLRLRYMTDEYTDYEYNKGLEGTSDVIDDSERKYDRESYLINFFGSFSEKRYFSSSKLFWGYSSSLVFKYTNSLSDQSKNGNSYEKINYYDPYQEIYTEFEENGDADSEDLSLSIQPKISFGYGKIDEAKDAGQAIYILTELKEKGIISRTITESDIQNLASAITKAKNVRNVDSREEEKESLKLIDTAFRKLKILKNTEIDYYNILWDNWNNSGFYSRKSGSETTFSIFPNYSFADEDSNGKNAETELINNKTSNSSELKLSRYTQKFTREISKKDLAGQIDYRYHKPINLCWQFDFNISSLFGRKIEEYENKSEIKGTYFSQFYEDEEYIYNNSEYENFTKSDMKNDLYFLENSIFAEVTNYPNSRTSLGARITGIWKKNWGESKSDDIVVKDLDFEQFKVISNLFANYYFSPSLRIDGDWYFNLYNEEDNQDYIDSYSDDNEAKGWSNRVSIKLSYYFF